MGEALLEVRGLEKRYGAVRALRGIDLTVRAGAIYGFIGPNGAGKTTAIRILAGLSRPTRGRVVLDGHDLLADRVHAARGLRTLVEVPAFYPTLSGAGNLAIFARLARAPKEEVDTLLEAVGLSEAAHRAVGGYSLGMRQRLGIAQALIGSPKLVVLDEPMNGLDPIGRNVFRDLLLVLKSEGVTVFLSSHVLHDIENIADRVGILNEGHLIQCGSLSEILAVDDRHVEIRFEIERGSVLREITPSFDELILSPQGWFGQVGDPERATRIVRKILESGGRLLRFERKRVSLEEFFLQQISGERANMPTRPDVAASPRNVPRAEADQTRAPRQKRTHEEVRS